VQGSEEARFPSCSLTPQQAAGNALAMHFHEETEVKLDSPPPFWHPSANVGGAMDVEEEQAARKRSIFDWIVLLGMVINLVIAVFMILYYFDLL
jgi:cobalamin biosynthesis protein CobD/CbiB